MPKGAKPKPDAAKPTEVPVQDTLSPVDKGRDFVKQGETV